MISIYKIYEEIEKYKNAFVLEMPNLLQPNDYSCGVDALQIVLSYYGIDNYVDDLEKELNVDQEVGTEMEDIINYANKNGLRAKVMKMNIRQLKLCLKRKIPVILLIQAYSKHKYTEDLYDDGHYVVAIGYGKDFIVFQDPERLGRMFLRNDELDKRWRGLGKGDKQVSHYGIVVRGPKPEYSIRKLEKIP